MEDILLEHQENWRYCRVRAGEKKPYPADWQNNPLRLHQVDSPNIGLILGPKGNGICAIDFDGTTAWTWIAEQGVDVSKLYTVSWTSGKTDRCQMAYWVPEEYWDVLKTKKIKTGDKEGFEFRWAGGQSVLPPSIHPETGQAYYWLVPPANKCKDSWYDQEIENIPDDLLRVWLEQIANEHIKDEEDITPEVRIEELTDDKVELVERALAVLKQRRPTLTYEEWCRISWGVAHELGRAVAKYLMVKYYPEQHHGEYDNLYKTWNKAKSPTIGSLWYMAGFGEKMERIEFTIRGKDYEKEKRCR
jgi:hypothetical protein